MATDFLNHLLFKSAILSLKYENAVTILPKWSFYVQFRECSIL